MKWAPTRNAPPASSALLRTNRASLEAEVATLESERREIDAALPGLVGEPDRYGEAQERLRDIGVLVPSKKRTLDAIREAIPAAEERERREAIEARIEEHLRKSVKSQRTLEVRYTKAAEAFAEVCREIQADVDGWRHLRALGDTVSPRVNVTHRSAEMTLRYDRFASPHSGLKSLTERLTVRAWDGGTLFESN